MALPETPSHRFWDRENSVLFATSAAFSAGDFYLTRANLRSNGQELNPVTKLLGRSSAGLAVNFIGQDVGVIGVSYFLHKTGHHKLERAVSMLNIGSSAAAVGSTLPIAKSLHSRLRASSLRIQTRRIIADPVYPEVFPVCSPRRATPISRKIATRAITK